MAVIPGFSIQHGKVISAMLITVVTGPILHPTLSMPLQLFPGWSWQCIPCPSFQNGASGRVPALPSDPEPRGRNRIATSMVFLTGIVADLFRYSLSFVFTARTGLLAQGISRRIVLLRRWQMAARLLWDAVTTSQGSTWNAELRPLCLCLSLLKSLLKVLQALL